LRTSASWDNLAGKRESPDKTTKFESSEWRMRANS
jgi:hypothetical protein